MTIRKLFRLRLNSRLWVRTGNTGRQFQMRIARKFRQVATKNSSKDFSQAKG
nr:MAG TPA: hypothetical protein [Caudoviricetes sp.]